MKSSKIKGLWLIAMLVLSRHQMSYATVIDPSNLAQNIIQVIQQKIESNSQVTKKK
jgi:conjugal transfer/entry exclusion protein